jgi:copper chaperone CopZ
MRTILLLIAFAASISAKAQVTKVSLQAGGLTCSMCSNSIYRALKTLDFIENVDADIKTYTFEISFKAHANVDFDQIRKKVENAGFTVNSFVATIHFDNLQVKNNQPVLLGNKTFLFRNVKDQSLNGSKEVRLLNKGFVPSKESKVNASLIKSPGPNVYHATI